MIKSAMGIILLALAAAIVLFLVHRPLRNREGFTNNTGIEKYNSITHNDYVQLSMKKYNPLADQYDVTRPNFARTDNPQELDRMTAQIKSALTTSEINPVDHTGSRFGITKRDLDISLPPTNEIISQVRKCEAIKGASCDALTNSEYKNCGICLKGGTSYSNPDAVGKYVGGLLVLPDDRIDAEAAAGGKGVPVYTPTAGQCPPGYLFVTKDACEKGKNRLECADAGEAGGFDGSMKDIARAKCAQVVNGDMNTYVYEPRGRKFNMNLRIITPTGVGIVKVFVNRVDNNQLIGSATIDKSGVEFTVPIRKVAEGDELRIKVIEEVPHRPRGRSEVFHYFRNKQEYNETISSSTKLCESIGSRIATQTELEDIQQKGAQVCFCGNTATTNAYPMNSSYHIAGCGSSGVIQCPTTTSGSWNNGKGGSWCYGIKPPKSVLNMDIFSKVSAFFTSIGDTSASDIWSQHGDDYQAPYYRAVIMQWESEDGKRVAPFESSILKMNGADTSQILRRLGTFTKSTMIVSPRPTGTMLRNQFWIWSNQPNSQSVEFNAKIPGIFKDPVYPEDAAIAPRGPLISTPEMMKLMRTSPCLRDGETAGKYSIECLNSLFRSAGGDLLRGKLAIGDGGLTQLLKLGDMDAIAEYLSGLYTIATTGRDSSGNRIGKNSAERIAMINDAAQKMFGFDIATPCEDIVEDAAGRIMLVQKSGSLDVDCLDYLWMNTGNDRARGSEDTSRATTIGNTYVWIYDRYSGLRSEEGSPEKRKRHPFQACQRTGSMAPLGSDGKPNRAAISEANSKGGILNVQNWYNQIHNLANYLPTSEATSKEQMKYVQQCYGVNRVEYVPNVKECDGVSARYVRVLATNVYGINPMNSCIQIPQIQVFDSKDNEIARGKPTSSHSVGYGGSPDKAVDGNAKPHAMFEGGYHDDCTTPDRQFWMVDLGSTVRVNRVVYFPRTDCCEARQLAAPIQLLNESKQIVAQQWIGQDGVSLRQPVNILFSETLGAPVFPISTLKDGIRFSLQSSTSFDRYLRHTGFAFWSASTDGRNPQTMDTLFRNDTTFVLRSARNGKSGMYTIESVNFPNYYLRHAGFRCWLHALGNTELEREDSSFTIIPALNGDPSMISLRSSNFPNHYISTKRENPNEVWITPVDVTNVWDVQRASWKMILPNI